ncbi:hypothetical protein AVEN_195556-1 [Araneus ventricosus]|uniref:Uncharacterized protein n=1 Tax=Araneus ventricosus TaxID=182803 RepID=A0A4Y2EXG1_ARAVE|nr:hypothetical protein AVEN_195556-1 [Araneus ventricosus]
MNNLQELIKALIFFRRKGEYILGLEEGEGLLTAVESSKSSDVLYSKECSSDKEDELISASASYSRDLKSGKFKASSLTGATNGEEYIVKLVIGRDALAIESSSLEQEMSDISDFFGRIVQMILFATETYEVCVCPYEIDRASGPTAPLTTESNKGGQPPALGTPSLGAYDSANRDLYARGHPRGTVTTHNAKRKKMPP